MDLPIIGATGPSGSNGGAHMAAIDKTYAVELTTTDGDSHILTLKFDRPAAGPDGMVDLGALKHFDAKASAMQNVARTIHAAHFGVELGMPASKVPLIEVAEGGRAIVWRHVTSFQFRGEWDAAAGMLAAEVEWHAKQVAA